jgi:hypothetical protein
MSALGHKRTFALQWAMSTLPPIATLIAHFLMSAKGQKRTLRHLLLTREFEKMKRDRHTATPLVWTNPFPRSPDATPHLGPVPATQLQTFLRSLKSNEGLGVGHAEACYSLSLLVGSLRSVHWLQILAGSAGHSFATQIGSQQFAHRCRSDCTLGFGMSATR